MKHEIIKFLIIFLLIPYCSFGQKWNLLKQVECIDIDDFLFDNRGDIFITKKNGELLKYSHDGVELLKYSSTRGTKIQEINLNSSLLISLFYIDLQEYVILNRYLDSPIVYKLADYDLGYVEDVSPNFPQNVWVVDISEFSLKLLDPRRNVIIENKSLAKVLNQSEYEILSFHNHQNRLYLTDEHTGVHVFDNIGNYLYKLDSDSPTHIGFDRDFLYYRKDKKLVFRHLYKGEDYQIELPNNTYSNFGYKNARLIAISKDGFDIYNYLSGN